MAEKKPIGPWTLRQRLGAGGNGEVWEASKTESSKAVALKLVNAKKAEKEPYRRFVQEIAALEKLGNPPGVLPVIESYLPESPSGEERPWLAMPIARLSSEALEDARLEVVVEAMASYAETLARLKAEHGIGHRDLKPQNLYELDDDWLVGDFGLIALPDAETITQAEKPIGSRHYTPYELIANPKEADPFAADVYSLGKTLWVLATGQKYPPEGNQPAGTRGFSINDSRPHPNAAVLDRLVDRMTRLHPEDRPTMEEVAEELRAWLQLPREGPAFEAVDVVAEIKKRLAGESAAKDREQDLKDALARSVKRFQELTSPLNEMLKQASPHAQIDCLGDKLTENLMRTLVETGAREILHRWQRCSQISIGPDYQQYALRFGRGIEVTSDGKLLIHAYIDVGDPETSRTDFDWRLEPNEAPIDTAQAEQTLRDAAQAAAEKLKEAMDVFLGNLPDEEI